MRDIAHRNEVASWRVRRVNEPEESQPIFALESENARLFDYWKVIVKRYPLLLAIAFIVFGLGAYFTLTATTLYTASSTLKIEPQNPTVTGVSTGATDLLPAQTEGTYDYYGTQFALLQSRTLAARVIRELNLESNPPFNTVIIGLNPLARVSDTVFGAVQSRLDALYGAFRAPAKTERKGGAASGVSSHSISRYLELLEVKPVKNTRLVEVRFNTADAELSQTLASAHAASFIRMILESRFELTKEARDFLDKKNAELRDKLQNAEAELNRFRQAHGVVSLEKGENIVVERLVDLNKQLTEAKAARIQAESLYRVVQNKNYNNLTEVMNHALIQQLKSSVASLEAEKARLSSIFMPEHPRMIEITQQVNEARQTLSREVGTIVRGIESNYNAAKAREEALQAEANKQQQTALDLKQVGVEYAVLQEEVNVNRALYESVLKRLHETNVSNDLAASNMQIVQQAELPSAPSAPRTGRTLLLVAALSLLLGMGGVFVVEYLDSTMHTPQEVWNAVGLNTVGTIPHLNAAESSATDGAGRSIGDFSKHYLPDPKPTSNGHPASKEILGPRSQLSIIAESYRTIRTSLMLSQVERPPQVILVTSPCPGDGKTVTTLNLGIVLAQGGHRVLAIDADLRKGRCHKVLGLQNFYGLSNFLTGHLSLEKSIQAGPVDGLSLLSRGMLPPNPADLLCSRKMKEALNTLRESYDFILIDSPPVNAVSDGALLSAICDGVLLVFNSEQTGIDSARRTVERLEALGAKLIGVVLNGIDIRDPDYADFRTYYPSYSQSEDEHLGDEKILDRPPEFTGERNEPDQMAAGVLSKRSVDQIVRKLSEAVGPMAAIIVRDVAASMGEAIEAFPVRKLDKLLDMTSREILDPGLKRRFQLAMSDELRDLDSL